MIFNGKVKEDFQIESIISAQMDSVLRECERIYNGNPYWIDELKELTGDDEPVYDYVMSFDETKTFVDKMTDFLDYMLVQYKQEGKNHLTIGIGCTGGQHRSVTLTNYFYNHYKEQYNCHKGHRDKKVR